MCICDREPPEVPYPSDEDLERQFLLTRPNVYEWSPEIWAELQKDDEAPIPFCFFEEGA